MEHLEWGLEMTVLGMGLVFALLALLWLLLTIVLKLDKEDEPEEELSPQAATVEAERIAAQVERLQRQYPQVAFALGERFGFEPEIFALLDARVAALDAPEGGLLECDGCKYREAAEDEHLHDHSHTATGGCAHAHPHG